MRNNYDKKIKHSCRVSETTKNFSKKSPLIVAGIGFAFVSVFLLFLSLFSSVVDENFANKILHISLICPFIGIAFILLNLVLQEKNQSLYQSSFDVNDLIRQAHRCAKIINTTINPKEYFETYQYMICVLKYVATMGNAKTRKAVKKDIKMCLKKKEYSIRDFVDRYFANLDKHICSLNTFQEKMYAKQQAEKNLFQAFRLMPDVSTEYVTNRFQNLLDSICGDEQYFLTQEYKNVVKLLGNEAPKSFNDYINMKTANTPAFLKLCSKVEKYGLILYNPFVNPQKSTKKSNEKRVQKNLTQEELERFIDSCNKYVEKQEEKEREDVLYY